MEGQRDEKNGRMDRGGIGWMRGRMGGRKDGGDDGRAGG